MKDKILFLAPYPTVENSKDGMISRVKAIDVLFENVPRVYLDVSLKKYWKKERYNDGMVDVYSLNFIRHFWTLFKLMNSFTCIYCHSIYSFRFLWFFIYKKEIRVTLDIHGVVPEEQKYLNKNKWKMLYYNHLEYRVFKILNNAVCVTNSMCNHYQDKYNWFCGKYLVYSIIPDNLHIIEDEVIEGMKNKKKDCIEVIYSGGIQGWQNIQMMLDKIKENQSQRICYTILTGDKELFNLKIKEANINSDVIKVVTRDPSELWKDYIASDYAFILRDDDIVNKVACPTKLIEYLYYGLIPIVLSPEIGDYVKLGYDYILIDDFDHNSIEKTVVPNKNNINIAKKLININKSVDLVGFVYSN